MTIKNTKLKHLNEYGDLDIIHPETNASQVVEQDDKQFITNAEKLLLQSISGGIQSLQLPELEIRRYKVKNGYNATIDNGYITLFGKLNDYTANYILENLPSFQIWLYVLNKHKQPEKYIHPNNVLTKYYDMSDGETKCIARNRLFTDLQYGYGRDINYPDAFGLGWGVLGKGNEGYAGLTIQSVKESLTSGYVPTEFILTKNDIVTLKDGTKAISLKIPSRHFIDNVVYKARTYKGITNTFMVYQNNRRATDSPGRVKSLYFKFQLTTNLNDKKVDGPISTNTMQVLHRPNVSQQHEIAYLSNYGIRII